MSLLNLTRPIRVDAAAGSVLPWETSYRTEPIATLERNGANLFYIEMSPSSATRLVGARIADPAAPSTREMDPTILLDRSATVVKVTAAPGEEIRAEVLAAAVEEAAPRHGDALLLVTGWGDRKAPDLDAESYLLDAPHLSAEAVEVLRSAIKEISGDLVLTDLPYLQHVGEGRVGKEWTSLSPWLRPEWPSPNAKAYLRQYDRSAVEADWRPTLALLKDAWLVLGLVGCAALDQPRPVLTIAPFQVRDVGEVPCTVLATRR